jgi:dihydrofolate reductase
MIIITRQSEYRADGAEVAHSLEEAYRRVAEQGETEAFIIGGAEIFSEALPHAERMYFTHVRATIEGDVHFPLFDRTRWRLTSQEEYAADAKNEYPFTFEIYERTAS